ncbi:MAG: NAD-binding protein [Cyanobacteria bacterium REEB459]|nr:NAD-binding protein [Cyanobacteria bacterium REEB459]
MYNSSHGQRGNGSQPAQAPESNSGQFVVCGLGSLGQYCAAALKQFGLSVTAIDGTPPQYWDIPELPDIVDRLLIGDCRYLKTLEEAGVPGCRAVLIVTSEERVNIEIAFAVRSLTPNARLVVLSSQENLNRLLVQQLGDFVAFAPTQFPAKAFALAALGQEIRSFFTLHGHLFRVVQVDIHSQHRWCNYRLLQDLNTSTRRVLEYQARGARPAQTRYHWHPNTRIQAGDSITYIETTALIEPEATRTRRPHLSNWRDRLPSLSPQTLALAARQLWERLQQHQTQQVAWLSALIMGVLFLLGTLLYKLEYADIGLQDALNVALVLAIGGFDNLFGQLKLPFPIPWWLYLYSISLTVAGTVFIGVLYAILTERVLAARFEFLQRRSPLPRKHHVVLIGLTAIGQQVATLLQHLKHPVVGISSKTPDPGMLPTMPLVIGDLKNSLQRVHLATASSLLMLTDDEVANLELGLMAHAANPAINLVIGTQKPGFARNVSQLLPYARVLEINALTAEAFAAAALGENILTLFHLDGQTLLVTEYQVEARDTLNGLLVAEVAYGYGVVPIYCSKSNLEDLPFPSDDYRLQVGDRLTVVATTAGLRRIEQADTLPRQWLVQIDKALSSDAIFEAGAAITRIAGCDLPLARRVMNHLPGRLEYPLYHHQALHLVRALQQVQVSAYLVAMAGAESGGSTGSDPSAPAQGSTNPHAKNQG